MTTFKEAEEAAAKAAFSIVVLRRPLAHGGERLELLWQDDAEIWRQSLDAALSALDSGGYVLVPKAPSLSMIYAAVDGSGTPKIADHQARDVWYAMLAAAHKEMEGE